MSEDGKVVSQDASGLMSMSSMAGKWLDTPKEQEADALTGAYRSYPISRVPCAWRGTQVFVDSPFIVGGLQREPWYAERIC